MFTNVFRSAFAALDPLYIVPAHTVPASGFLFAMLTVFRTATLLALILQHPMLTKALLARTLRPLVLT